MALVFVAPLIVTVFAPLFLSERLGWRRALAAFVGFIGVLILINPNAEAFQVSLIWALAAGISFGFYLLITRKMKSSEAPLATLFYTGIVGLVLATPFALLDWTMPTPRELLLMIAMGFFAAFGHYFVILAFRYGEASTVAPFQYFEMVTSTLISFIVFGFLPGFNTWLGILVIVGAGLFITIREAQLKRSAMRLRR